ncbi:hypothetical protein HMPREF3187_01764 [Aerococcus christensenii]|uniref:Uncharacterized protein n=1 Tax=Aerococcus christensenii TaxID=87541 RepID=A0A133XQA6_9LACT|nr:hypothetical protein HMPREF3187_01764 [Aerococcus christensenii]
MTLEKADMNYYTEWLAEKVKKEKEEEKQKAFEEFEREEKRKQEEGKKWERLMKAAHKKIVAKKEAAEEDEEIELRREILKAQNKSEEAVNLKTSEERAIESAWGKVISKID